MARESGFSCMAAIQGFAPLGSGRASWSLTRLDLPQFHLPLWLRASDLVAGFGTAFFVAPFVTTIDKAVVEATNGKRASIREGLAEGWGTLMRRPFSYFGRREFGFVVGVYTLTFWAANAASSYAEVTGASAQQSRFLATVLVNIPGSVLQDRMFTRWFGVARPRMVPAATLGVWAMRDAMTCASSFALPLTIAAATNTPVSAVTFFLPVATQCFSSPLHLLGLNMYNTPASAISGSVIRERLRFVQGNYLRTTAARIGRIAPTFGAGSNLNGWLREKASGR